MARYLSLLFIVILFYACTPAGEEPLTDYPNSHLLLSADQLSEDLQSNNILLIDARDEIEDGVIPGAVHFPAISSLTDPDHSIEHFLVGPDRFQELMREHGLNNDSRVVIYDGGNALASARLFYALDYYGFSNAAILNGGIQGWNDHGFELGESPASPTAGNFQFQIQEGLACDFEYITAAADADDKIVFDARSRDEYTGEDERAQLSGHIPNAVHLEWSSVLEQDGIPYFLPPSDIQSQYTALGITPDKEVIPHCHTNVRGSHAYFTLRLMGYDSVRPYEGSWSDYGNREGAPISRVN
ncbi:sulfurtransferase [Rhodohalobacter sp. SW132]|uniref:sulfurtransferase n=1 Tax=Rhodohalobacter sp. SW132 TaxID=2293433 RepID=UPI000E26AF4B|nr:sulfurtransferase [Rhodohalobacter sp. SW132]REL38945.1 sulfurtransferase [Rhodohalobacter sp. SW132]